MEIAIIGSGIVGAATGKYFSDVLKHHVVFQDINKETIRKLKTEGYHATTSLEDAVISSSVGFICVPTPNYSDGYQDKNIITAVSRDLGIILKKTDDLYTVAVKSTVLPGTTRKVVGNFIRHYSKKKLGEEVLLDMNPEFLTFIQNSWTKDKNMDKKPKNESKIVIGEYNRKSGNVLEKIYEKSQAPKFRVSLEEAEFIKYANNYILPARISVWNELFLMAKALSKDKLMKINTNKIAEILTLDERIGKYGSVHGKAYGGPCFEKDPQAFLSWAEGFNGFNPIILRAIVETNKDMARKYGIRK